LRAPYDRFVNFEDIFGFRGVNGVDCSSGGDVISDHTHAGGSPHDLSMTHFESVKFESPRG